MLNELDAIIEYLKSIRNLKKWDIIMIWNNFYIYNGFYTEDWIHLVLTSLSLDEYNNLEENEVEHTVNVLDRCIKFKDEFNLKRLNILLEKIIKEYENNL